MSDAAVPPGPRPNCYQCRHFAVSWDPRLPYQCGLMGFKSRALPCLEILRVDGLPCQGFAPRAGGAEPAPPGADKSALTPQARSHGAGCTVQISAQGLQAALSLARPAVDLAEAYHPNLLRRPARGA